MNKIRKDKKRSNSSKRVHMVARSVSGVAGGNFLNSKHFTKQLPFIGFIVLIALAYIANSYSTEKTIININRIKKENEVLRYEHVLLKSELMHFGRSSEVVKKLESTGIKESRVPPYKIYTRQIGK